LLDEPTSSVDTLVEARLAEILRRLSRQMSIVMVSHDLGFVSALVKNVACVNRRVVVHPTDAITGEVIHQMYDQSVRVVRHENIVTQPGHSHEGHGHG
jgi:zinc transport system ATP-binding protein